MEIPSDVDTESDRVFFIKAVAQFMVSYINIIINVSVSKAYVEITACSLCFSRRLKLTWSWILSVCIRQMVTLWKRCWKSPASSTMPWKPKRTPTENRTMMKTASSSLIWGQRLASNDWYSSSWSRIFERSYYHHNSSFLLYFWMCCGR